MKKLAAAALAISVMLTSCPFALAENETRESGGGSAVSGYVSADSGDFKLVGTDKTPTIYVDDTDYEGVVRAVDDLKDDIKTVTGVEPTVTNEIRKRLLAGGSTTGFDVNEDGMWVGLTEEDGDIDTAECYVAVYDRKGTLTGIVQSDRRIKDERNYGFEFDTVLERPAGGQIRAFVWQDMKPITEVLPLNPTGKQFPLDDVDIVIGTIGESEVIDNLVRNEKIDVSEVEGLWESFTIQRIRDTLIIAGSDKRGTIYGIYDLCEKIGVSPWSFWADTVVPHEDNLYINLPDGGYTEGEPSVQYRGIFLNDEFNMSEWSKSMGNTGVNMNNATYEKIFELLLRLKANYLWPAMHTYSTAFNNTDGNAELADKYGIVMGSSHCEPLLRNNLGELYNFQQEWQAAHPDKTLYINAEDDAKRKVSYMWTDKDGSGNAVDNKEFLTDYWRARAKANGGYENTYTLGMRGVHDGAFSTNMNQQTAMTEILAAQRQILEEELCGDGKDITDIPQVFIPYKEMLDLYNGGLKVPDDVTLMWADDNFGYIRQLPTEAERERSGGAGVYYHLSYRGRPTSYLWLSTTQLGLVREEMTKAYDMGAQKIWVANVGDLKPAETQIEYFLDLARDVEEVRNTDICDWLSDNAKRDFGFDDTQAAEYADIQNSFYEIANSRRPEHLVQGLFNLEAFGDEGQRYVDTYTALVERSQALYNTLDEAKQPSFFELQLYPLRSCRNAASAYVNSDRSKLYKEQGRGAAVNKYAQASKAASDQIDTDTAAYNSMLDGKWNKMMTYQPSGLVSSYGDWPNLRPAAESVSELPYTNMQIIPEGSQQSISFTKYSTEPKYIDIINTGTGSFDWRAETDAEWIKLNKTSGTVADNDRIYVSIDQSMLNGVSGGMISVNQAAIEFTRYVGETAVDTQKVAITFADIIGDELPEKTYAENDGYVSIEAEHYTESVKNGEYEWKVEKDFGRSGDSVKIYPNTAKTVSTPNKENSAYLEYNVYFTTSGTFPIDVYRMPTINELSGATLRCRIGIDDAAPVQFNGNTKTTDKSAGTDAWGKGVLQNTEVLSGTITVSEAGLHTIRLYNESAGVVIDKFVITTGDKKASYYGAPESYNTTYNNTMKPLPAPSAAAEEQTGDITSLFEPLMIITGINKEELEDGEEYYTVTAIPLKECDEDGVFVIASYDKDGNMIDATYTDHRLLVLKEPDSDISYLSVNNPADFSIYTDFPSLEGAETIQCMLIRGATDFLNTGEIYDYTDYEPLAFAFEQKVSDNTDVSLMASYDEGYVYPATRMNDYIGKESVCIISEQGSTNTSGIKYIRQNTVKENTYDKILFNGEGKFDLKIKVAGIDDIISETVSTIINIRPDTDPVTTSIYSQSFDSEPSDSKVTITAPAAYESSNKAVNMGTGGTVSVDFENAITAAQGETVTIVSKIAYGKESGKYMNYAIKDTNGKNIVYSHITGYNVGTQQIQIGDTVVYEEKDKLPAVIKRDNSALKAGFTTYTTVIDFADNTVTLTLSSTGEPETYTGKLPAGTSYNIKQLLFTNNYTNSGRVCYMDDVSITKSKAAAYTIQFDIPESAEMTLTDGVTGAVITPETDGTYKLCDGIYNYTVTADGQEVTGKFELSPATEEKTITIPVTQ